MAEPEDKPIEPPVTPTPSFVPTDDFKRYQETSEANYSALQNQYQQLNATILSIAQNINRPAPTVTTHEPNTNDLAEALRTGEGADKFEAAIEARVGRRMKPVEDKLAQLETQGLGAIANMNRAQATAGMTHYKRFKKEIDSYIDQLPPAAKLNSETMTLAYNAVVGQHTQELIDEAKEGAIRAMREDPNMLPGADTARGRSKSKVPDARTLMGEDAAQALREKGTDEDQFAKKLGYSDWDDYMTKTKMYEENVT